MDAQQYYYWLMKQNATSYHKTILNSKGQTIEFYEHPTMGDTHSVIAVCHSLKVARPTDFFDTDDFYSGSEYNPVFVNGHVYCEFEL